MKTKALLLTGILLAAFFTACDNSGTEFEDFSEAVTMAEDEVFDLKSTEAIESDISSARFSGHMFKGNMRVGGPHLFFGKNFPNCATVSVSNEDFPKEIVIDYGEGCTGRAGLEKRGKITINMTDTILNAGAMYTLEFENVNIGNRQIEKTATITNEGQNQDGNWVITSETVTTSTMENEGNIITVVREYTQQKEWLSGFETPEIEDDKFLRTGGGSITVDGEIKFERNITTAIYIDRSCMFPVSGIVEITKDDESMVIDYGEGDCDNIAVVTKDGESEEIELVSGHFKKGFKKHHRHMKRKNGWW